MTQNCHQISPKHHITIASPSLSPSPIMGLSIFLFLATLLSTSHARSDVINPIRLLRPHSDTGSLGADRLDCLSWRLGVETSNLRDWISVPESCLNYIENYMLSKQYYHDCEVVADAATEYAKSFPLAGDGKDLWVFDVDETLLSNLIYFGGPDVQFGTIPINVTSLMEWIAEAEAPALPAILRLYNTVSSLGFKTAIITGVPEVLRERRIINLKNAGYSDWETLILRGEADLEKTQLVYKSKKRGELVKQGYRIVGNVGDQWSDLLGENGGNRTFKVPNPMYYAP